MNLSISTYNICLRWPQCFFNLHPYERLDQFTTWLYNNKTPDILFLQEFFINPDEFITDMRDDGIEYWDFPKGTGLAVLSKVEILSNKFIKFPWKIRNSILDKFYVTRGIQVVEFDNFYIINTHLQPYDDKVSIKSRHEQVMFIIKYIKELDKDVILVGDLNLNIRNEMDKLSLELLYDRCKFRKLMQSNITISMKNNINYFETGKRSNSMLDYILVPKEYEYNYNIYNPISEYKLVYERSLHIKAMGIKQNKVETNELSDHNLLNCVIKI